MISICKGGRQIFNPKGYHFKTVGMTKLKKKKKMDDVSILSEGTIKKNENKKESIDINDHHHRIKKPLLGVHISEKRGSLDERKIFFF